jgi:hypothetical protein
MGADRGTARGLRAEPTRTTVDTRFNVIQFGAKGNGNTDDTAAGLRVFSQRSVQLCKPAHPAPGRARSIPAWTYRDFGGSVLRLRDDKACCLIDMTGAIIEPLSLTNIVSGTIFSNLVE